MLTNFVAAPLFIAAHRGHAEVMRALCEARADKDRRASDGATPLLVASEVGHVEDAIVIITVILMIFIITINIKPALEKPSF